MPTRGGSDVPKLQMAVAKLREQAARARRLAAGVTNRADERLLTELADSLDAEAAELEQRGG
jgi:hypothetical protein